ncbi:hypothetical protein V1289_002669 [Bradyrhizobium sp. AZCC 2289]
MVRSTAPPCVSNHEAPIARPWSSEPEKLYADLSNSSRPISMRRISLVPAPIS